MTEKDEYFMHRAIQMAEKGMDSNAGGAFSLTGSPQYRFGYQGQFAEKDPETGLNSFEARSSPLLVFNQQTTELSGGVGMFFGITGKIAPSININLK